MREIIFLKKYNLHYLQGQFGLHNGIKYYLLDVEVPNQIHNSRRHSHSGSQSSSMSEIVNVEPKHISYHGGVSKHSNDHIPISSSQSHSNSEQSENVSK